LSVEATSIYADSDALLMHSWQRVCDLLCVDVSSCIAQKTYQQLIAYYAGFERAYHNLQHLSECLTWCHQVAPLIQQPMQIELALWFHDAIYDPQAANNELQSALWAKDFLASVNIDESLIKMINDLIMATQHHQADNIQQQWLLDIDLAILGSPSARFEQYQQQIRQEYAFVGESIYQQKRRQVLQSFYDRPRIYQTDFFFKQLERQAKLNLKQALGN
jgi:predicted metal-dependent HD superfamily phosphohydrolase